MILSCLKCQGVLTKQYDSPPLYESYSCSRVCCLIDFNQKQIEYYDFDQFLNNIHYRVEGNQDHNFTKVFLVFKSKVEIMKLSYQPIANQQEWNDLLPRLLKLKAFI